MERNKCPDHYLRQYSMWLIIWHSDYKIFCREIRQWDSSYSLSKLDAKIIWTFSNTSVNIMHWNFKD